MWGLCEIPHKLILKELQIQQLDTLTYSDIMNISMNMHETLSSHLFFLPKNFVEIMKHLILYMCKQFRKNTCFCYWLRK